MKKTTKVGKLPPSNVDRSEFFEGRWQGKRTCFTTKGDGNHLRCQVGETLSGGSCDHFQSDRI